MLTFGGYYGVDKVNGTPSHGNFAAVGTLSVPIFSEAKLARRRAVVGGPA